MRLFVVFFFFNDTATTEIYTLSLHDALPIWSVDTTLLIRACVAPVTFSRSYCELGTTPFSFSSVVASRQLIALSGVAPLKARLCFWEKPMRRKPLTLS